MPQNLELKCRLSAREVPRALSIARRLGAREAGILTQVDTYYSVPSGRLKLRSINSRLFQLIHYHRSNTRSSRFSRYSIISISQPHDVKKVLHAIFGKPLTVRKRRRLFLYKNARIHFDTVNRLGSFIEFEVVANRGRKQAVAFMRMLRRVFQIKPQAIIGVSYRDLLQEG
ncbi:MAG TPA: class IV adenylate cyclase [Bacteroidota bacterium]|nr:class IV adenylate cyclase [Bacteroidota bacterium]